MTVKPNLLSLRAINLYILFLVLPTAFFFLLLTTTNLYLTVLGTIAAILISFRFSLFYLFEKVVISDKEIIYKLIQY